MVDYLHEGILVDILHRLPVKSLLRCTSVCKSWYILITSSEFISSHLNFTASNAPLLLLRRCIRNSERYELYSDNEFFTRRATLDFPFTSINSFFTVVGTCNGLLCLSDDRVYYTNIIILWNPSIRRSIPLPTPNLIYNSYATFTQCLGFGFDSVANDYKVVRITHVDSVQKPQIELYKMSSGTWQDVSYLGLDYVVYNRSRSVYVNGATHWVARDMDSHDLIVLFDMSNEVFRPMMLPVSLASNDPTRSMDLVVFRESLALILWNVAGTDSEFCLWAMQQHGAVESWTKSFRFDFGKFGSGFMRPLWVRRNGEVMMIWQDVGLVCYGSDGDEVKDVGVGGSRSKELQRSLHVENYTSSLVLLERGAYCSDVFTHNSAL